VCNVIGVPAPFLCSTLIQALCVVSSSLALDKWCALHLRYQCLGLRERTHRSLCVLHPLLETAPRPRPHAFDAVRETAPISICSITRLDKRLVAVIGVIASLSAARVNLNADGGMVSFINANAPLGRPTHPSARVSRRGTD